MSIDNCDDVGWILGYTSDTSQVVLDVGSPRPISSIDLYSVYGGVSETVEAEKCRSIADYTVGLVQGERGCNMHIEGSNTPDGPWQTLLNEAVYYTVSDRQSGLQTP